MPCDALFLPWHSQDLVVKSPEPRVSENGGIGRCREARKICATIYSLCTLRCIHRETWFMKWFIFDSMTWSFEVSFFKKENVLTQTRLCERFFFQLSNRLWTLGVFLKRCQLGQFIKDKGFFRSRNEWALIISKLAWGDSLNVFVEKHLVNYHVHSIKENAWGKWDIATECVGFTLKAICT